MQRLLIGLWTVLLALAASAPAAAAQQPSPVLDRRAGELVALLNGETEPGALFAPSFLTQIPPEQVRGVADQLRAQYGRARRIERIEVRSPAAATVHVDHERAVVGLDMALEPQPPHRIIGLRVTGAEVRNDSFEDLARAFAALPGEAGFVVARLGEGAPLAVAGHQTDQALAIGSAFKLIVLAELSRSVQAGERRWSDVVPLARRSLPSGILQAWPQGSPLTLHSLAALMISLSDNTATDLLLHTLGRDRVERMMETLGVRAAARNRPFLTTREAFALKSAPEAVFSAWRGGDERRRRELLASEVERVAAGPIDPARFAGSPTRLEVEWFASAEDLARIMDWLRRHGGEQALAILAINPGIGPAAARELDYLGFKGGSEPGVLNLTFLARNRQGVWHAIAGTWNNGAAPLEEARFVAMMVRAVQLVR